MKKLMKLVFGVWSLLLGAGVATAVELPAGYECVEYIESTVDGNQYIDTGYTHKANTKVVCSVDVAPQQGQGYPAVFGSFNSGYTSKAFVFFPRFGWEPTPALCRTGFEQMGTYKSFPYGGRVDLVCEGTQASWRESGAASDSGAINNTQATADDGGCAMNIFVINNNGAQPDNSWCVMKLYSFRIYEGETLVRDFVPCVWKITGQAGLYEAVEGKFHPNMGGDYFRYPGCITRENFGNYRTLQSGKTYRFAENIDFTANEGESAMAVAPGANVVLEIPEGVTVKLTGGMASSWTATGVGAGAGIEVPSDATLTIIGAGALFATGGRAAEIAAHGQAGLKAHYDISGYQNTDKMISSSGGAGGVGGGGAGAGIGGRGGNGGAGGGYSSRVSASYINNDYISGSAGANGSNGASGGTCGTVIVRGSVNVTAKGGKSTEVAANGGGYSESFFDHENHGSYIFIGYSAGGGGGGGGGGAASDIGGGGSGGGGGGGGAGGGISWYYYVSRAYQETGDGHGGEGGAGTVNGAAGGSVIGSETLYNSTYYVRDSVTYDISCAQGGKGGAAGAKGGDGSLIVAPTATINAERSEIVKLEIVAVPQVAQGLVYNGRMQTGVPSGAHYAISENTATTAGSYMAMAILENDGYCWADGTSGREKVFFWSIAQQPVTPPAPCRFCFTGSEITAFTDKTLYTVRDGKATDVGEYSATLTLRDTVNYRWEDTCDPETRVGFDIHKYVDDGGDGMCDKCGGKIRYLYGAVTYLEKTVNDDGTLAISEEKTSDIVQGVFPGDAVWGVSGKKMWCVVDKTMTMSSRPVVKGDVCLLLMNGAVLTANKGITVEKGNSLRIYAQSDDESTMGKLIIAATEANGSKGVTAIGGSNGGYASDGFDGGPGGNCGDVYFYGGEVSFECEEAPCIGGGHGGNGFTDGSGSTGDGGKGGNGGRVYFYGGMVSLKSGNSICIGGGNGGNGGSLGIGLSGLDVPAAAHAGNGNNGGNSGWAYFYGGSVSCESEGVACIGGGKGGAGGKGYDGSFYKPDGCGGISGSLDENYWNVSGKPVIKCGESAQSATVVSAYTSEKYLSVHYHVWESLDVAFHWNADHTACTATRRCRGCGEDVSIETTTEIALVEDTAGADCREMGRGHYEASFPTLGVAQTESVFDTEPGPHVDEDGNGLCDLCGRPPVDNYGIVTAGTQTLTAGNWFVEEGQVDLAAPLVVEGDVTLHLAEGAVLNAARGIVVSKGNSLTVLGVGNILAQGEVLAAGIGGANGQDAGEIILKTSGMVTATGGELAAGIGGGYTGAGGTVTIDRGTVLATGGKDGAGIGGGYNGAGGTVTICGGSIKASSIQSQPKDDAGANVYCVTVEVEKVESVEKLRVEGLDDYGTKGIVPVDGKLYLWLPDGTYMFTVDGVKYRAVVNGAATTAGLYPTCEGGVIAEGEGGEWIVTPNAGVTEITVASLPEGATVAVPPSVTKVSGVADAQVKVKSGAYDITGAFTVIGGAIALDPNGSVTIGGETIPVRPMIGDLDEGGAFVVGEGCVTVTVRAIPGLKYELRRWETLGAESAVSSKSPYQVVASETATGATVTLVDGEPPTDKAFYRVAVSAGREAMTRR